MGDGEREHEFPFWKQFDSWAWNRPACVAIGASAPRVQQERQREGMPFLSENLSLCVSLWPKAGFCLIAAGGDRSQDLERLLARQVDGIQAWEPTSQSSVGSLCPIHPRNDGKLGHGS